MFLIRLAYIYLNVLCLRNFANVSSLSLTLIDKKFQKLDHLSLGNPLEMIVITSQQTTIAVSLPYFAQLCWI